LAEINLSNTDATRREMHGEIFANLSFGELAQQLRRGRAEPDRAGSAGRLAAEASPPMRHMAAAGRPVGNLLYLVLVGVVASATIGVFFGIGFFLLVQPSREVIANLVARDGGIETDPLRSTAFPSQNSDELPAERPAVVAPPEESVAAPAVAPVTAEGQASAATAKGATQSEVRSRPRHTRAANRNYKLNPTERAAWREHQILSAAYDRAHR
jgi:predicted lipid-binding transport protein (Tim44 family)